jgi:hypothetical protein
VTSGRRDKQIQVYDPAIAGKQPMVQKSVGQADKYVGSKKPGQNVPAGQGAGAAGGGRSNSAARHLQQGAGGVAQQQGEVSRDIGIMMGIPPLPGRDISSSTSKTGKVNNVSRSSSSKR